MASLELIHYQPRQAEINDGSLQWKDLKRKPINNAAITVFFIFNYSLVFFEMRARHDCGASKIF